MCWKLEGRGLLCNRVCKQTPTDLTTIFNADGNETAIMEIDSDHRLIFLNW